MDKDKLWSEPNLGPTQAKRQHYVPQLLLRPFTKSGKIRVTDLIEGKTYETATLNVAVEKGFYDQNIDGMIISNEGWLAQLENEAKVAIDKLLEDPNNIKELSDIEEIHIARFLVALRFRTPAFRDYSDRLSEVMLQKIKENIKAQIFNQNNKNEAEIIWQEMDNQPMEWWFNQKEPEQPSMTASFMLSEVQGFANILRAAPWRIGKVPETQTIYTSDNPVAGYLRPVRPWWERAAFGSLTYFIPLSPKVLLNIERRRDKDDNKELQSRGERMCKDFSEWDISFTKHIITTEATRYLYGEGSIVDKRCAYNCIKRIEQAQVEFAVNYLGFDPRPPRLMH